LYIYGLRVTANPIPRTATAIISLLLTGAALATAQISVSSETAPPGGTAQFKVWPIAPATAPPTNIILDFDPAVVAVQGIGAFNADGNLYGAASISGGHVVATLSTGVVGIRDLPLLTATVKVLPGVLPGTQSSVKIATRDVFTGHTTVISEGVLTVGGDLWIDGVSPSEGLLPAGSVVVIHGGGFTADTTLDFDAVAIATVRFVNANEMDATLSAPAAIKGKRVTVQRGEARVDFFCSDNPLVSSVYFQGNIIFPEQTMTSAGVSSSVGSKYVAVQNPGVVPVSLDFYWFGPYFSTAHVSMTLPPLGISFQSTGSHRTLEVVAPSPMRMIVLPDLGSVSTLTPTSPPGPQRIEPFPAALTFDWQVGAPDPPARPISAQVTPWCTGPTGVTASVTTSAGGNWLHATPPTGTIQSGPGPSCSGLGPGISISVTPSGLSPGLYTGTVTLSTGGPQQPGVLPVTLTVAPLPVITASFIIYPSFGAVSDGAPPRAQTVKVDSPGTPAQFTVTATTATKGNATGCFQSQGALFCDWIIVAPAQGTTPATVSITANPKGLAPGFYSGTVTINGPRNTQAIPVGMSVDPQPGSLSFVAQVGAAAITQTVNMPGDASPFVTSATTDSGGKWLNATVNGVINVTADPAGLSTGTYSGTVTITSAKGVVHVPVTLKVWDTVPKLTATPTRLDLISSADGPQIPEAHVTLATGEVPQNIMSTTISGDSTLVTAFSSLSRTPTDLLVNVHTDGLRQGVYHTTITVTAGAQSIDIPVTLTMTSGAAVTPIVGTVVNGASAIQSAIAPGEIITLHGTNLGPPTAAGLVLQNGQPATTLSGTRVLFDGVPAPILYASVDQLNVIVPREIAGRSVTLLEVEYFGTRSTAVGIPIVDASPAVFTLDSSGAGPGAVLNQDNTVNMPANPADRGSVIQIFATGANSPVTVTIGGVDAQVTYAGPAPQSVDGLFQINAIVPSSLTPATAVPLVVRAGSKESQTAVTVSVH
jgi:uncharacterized protein (TIGR03437 family)